MILIRPPQQGQTGDPSVDSSSQSCLPPRTSVSTDGTLRGARHKSFEHYMLEGPIAAMAAVEKATGERAVNCVGYCLGGTLLASTLAYLAARGYDRVKSATYFVTLVDFVES